MKKKLEISVLVSIIILLFSVSLKGQYPVLHKKYLPSYKGPRNGSLTEKEMTMARIAWKYFQNNYQEETGLVNSTHNYPSVTMWDLASYIGGLVSAYELGIIEKSEFDKRITKLVSTFNSISFFKEELPNKAYNTKTAQMVNYVNKPGEIGYSALDLGRLLIWLKIIKEKYPQYSNSIDKFILRWKFCNVIDEKGTMFGAAVKKSGEVVYLQEGRLGYEEYAAKGFELWGFNTKKASKSAPFNYITIFGVEVGYDTRDPRVLGAHNYVVAESSVLDAIELGWDTVNDSCSNCSEFTDQQVAELSQRIYKAQERRYAETGIITARTEHQLDKKPYFVYDTIFSDGYAWNTITEKGEYVPQFSAVALKGAIGMWAVWNTKYTDLLFDYVADQYDPRKGFYEGIYENGKGLIKTFTANNNGIILECLMFKKFGKILSFSGRRSMWDKKIDDEFFNANCIKERQISLWDLYFSEK